jgi:stage V sporulation protein B
MRLAKQMALRTSAIFLVKLMGFITKITMFRLLEATGVGLYQITYSIYVILLTCIVGGVPTSLARSTALNARTGWRLLKILAIAYIIIGGASALACYTFAGQIALLFGDGRLEWPIQRFAPALLIVPVLHVIRGFLQGREYYSYIAISELIEQAIRVITMLTLVSLWMDYGIESAVSGAVSGAVMGAVAALMFLLIIVSLIPKSTFIPSPNERSNVGILSQASDMRVLLHLSLYISVSRFVMPVLDFFDALIIPHRLQLSGVSLNEAISVFGELCGMVIPITYLPLIVTASLSHILYTKISVDWLNNNKEQFYRRTRFALEVAWLWGFGSAIIFYVFAEDISQLIFNTPSAARGIRYLCLMPFLAAVREFTTTVLWGVGRKKEPIIALVTGVCTSILVIYWLCAIPGHGYLGAALGILSFEVSSTLLNIWFIRRIAKQIFSWTPLFAGMIVMTIVIIPSSIYFNNHIHWGAIPNMVQFIVKPSIMVSFIMIYILLRFLNKSYIKLR